MKNDVLGRLFQALFFRQSQELTLCLLKKIFQSRTSLFSFTSPPHFHVAAATKSIGQSNILNIEMGEGGIDRMQLNLIANEEKSTIYSYLFMSQPFCMGL